MPYYVVLTPNARGETDAYRVHEPTYWTVCDAQSKFEFPGVPTGDNYTMIVFNNGRVPQRRREKSDRGRYAAQLSRVRDSLT